MPVLDTLSVHLRARRTADRALQLAPRAWNISELSFDEWRAITGELIEAMGGRVDDRVITRARRRLEPFQYLRMGRIADGLLELLGDIAALSAGQVPRSGTAEPLPRQALEDSA